LLNVKPKIIHSFPRNDVVGFCVPRPQTHATVSVV